MSEKINHLEAYLLNHVEDGVKYVRAKEIAEYMYLTPKQIGVLLSKLHKSNDSTVSVEKWARHKSTTWQIKKSTS